MSMPYLSYVLPRLLLGFGFQASYKRRRRRSHVEGTYAVSHVLAMKMYELEAAG